MQSKISRGQQQEHDSLTTTSNTSPLQINNQGSLRQQKHRDVMPSVYVDDKDVIDLFIPLHEGDTSIDDDSFPAGKNRKAKSITPSGDTVIPVLTEDTSGKRYSLPSHLMARPSLAGTNSRNSTVRNRTSWRTTMPASTVSP